MINRDENYGRHLVRQFAALTSARTVVDLGAGHGEDLRNIKSVLPEAICIGVEGYKPYQDELERAGIEVIDADIECCRFPFEDGAVELSVDNQLAKNSRLTAE